MTRIPDKVGEGSPAQLSADLTYSATSLGVDGDVGGWPSSDFQIAIGDETILVGTRTGNQLTGLTRGHNDTDDTHHPRGADVVVVTTAAKIRETATAPQYSETYAGSGSHQTVAADLELAAGAGKNTDSAFLAPGMGNLLGAALTKTRNYLFGWIGAFSVTGAKATEFQAGGAAGIIMDGVTDADGAVVAILDGSDPSSETGATAAFAARQNNAHPDSGFDYGVDLHDEGRGDIFSVPGEGLPLAIRKADIRYSKERCDIAGEGAPVDYTDGSPPATGEGYAAIGSEYTDLLSGDKYVNTGTKAHPAWTQLGAGGGSLPVFIQTDDPLIAEPALADGAIWVNTSVLPVETNTLTQGSWAGIYSGDGAGNQAAISPGGIAFRTAAGGSRISIGGSHMRQAYNVAPNTASFDPGMFAIWVDPTPGATKLKITALDSNGAERTGSVNLS